MLGIPESVLIFVAAVLAVGVVLFALVRLLPRGTRPVVRAFWCPFRWRDVTVEFQEDPFGHGRYLDVKRCTAFEPGAPVTCGKLCRYLRHFAARRSVRERDV